MVAGQPIRQGGRNRRPPSLAKKIRNLGWRTSQKPQTALASQRGQGDLSAATDLQVGQSPWLVEGGRRASCWLDAVTEGSLQLGAEQVGFRAKVLCQTLKRKWPVSRGRGQR